MIYEAIRCKFHSFAREAVSMGGFRSTVLRKSQPQEERKPIYQAAYVIKAIIQIGANIGIFIFTLIKLFVRFSFFMPRMSFKWKNGIADNFAKTTLLQLTGPVSSLVCNLELGLQFWYYCGVTKASIRGLGCWHLSIDWSTNHNFSGCQVKCVICIAAS